MVRSKKQIDPNLKPEELARQAHVRAVRLLGTREHSSHELREKLGAVGFDAEIISATLAELQAAGYQSDERFSELYTEQLLRKGHGPLSIRAKLASRGIDSAQVRLALEAQSADWSAVAADALNSRFSMTELSDPDQNNMGKFARFLQRRGFSSTDSIKAIRLVAETVSD